MDWQRRGSIVAAIASLGVALTVCTVAARSGANPLHSVLSNNSGISTGRWFDCTVGGNDSHYLLASFAYGIDGNGNFLCNPTVDYSGSTQTADCGSPAYTFAELVGVATTAFAPSVTHAQGSNASYPNFSQAAATITASPGNPGSCRDVNFTANSWGN